MDTTTTLDATPDEVATYEATINRYIAEMEQMQKQIAANRREIEFLKAETEVMLANTLSLLKVG